MKKASSYIFSVTVIVGVLLSIAITVAAEVAFVGNGVTIPRISSYCFVDSTILIGTRGGGMFEVSVSDQTVAPRNTGLDYLYPVEYSRITAIRSSSQNQQVIYTGLNHSFILSSEDQGATWGYAGTVWSARTITSLVMLPGDSGTLFAGTDKGIHRSDDGGLTWEIVDGGKWREKITCLAPDPSDGNTIYAGTWQNGVVDTGRVYCSRDGGSTWRHTEVACPVDKVVVDPTSAGSVYVLNTDRGMQSGYCIYYSSDYGEQFSLLDVWFEATEVNDVAFSPGGVLYAGTARGIYWYDREGRVWRDGNITPDNVIKIDFHGSTLYFITADGMYWHAL